MKKFLISFVLIFFSAVGAMAQKYAFVDMDYIMKSIPNYEVMTKQIEQASSAYQKQLEAVENSAKDMYKKYQADLATLTPDQKKSREEAIVAKEKEIMELKMKFFGPEGELVKKRNAAMKPLEDAVWQSLKSMAKEYGLMMIIDRSSSKIVYADPSIDISTSVLAKLGINK